MSFIITRVSGTVGNPVTVCVITNLENDAVHAPLMEWVKKEFGQWASVEYLETYHVSTISTTDLDIDRLYYIME